MAGNSSFHNLHQHTCQSDSGATVDLGEMSCGQVGGQRKVKTVQQEPIDENKENVLTVPEQKLPEEGPDNENPDQSVRTEPGCAGNSSCDDDLEITDENVQNDTDTVSTDEHQFYSESAECDTSECTKANLQTVKKVDEEEKPDLTGDQRTHSSDKDGPNIKGTDENVNKGIQETVRSDNENQKAEGDINILATSKSCSPDAEKIKEMTDSIAKNIKVAYKVAKSCTHNFNLQAFFFSLFILTFPMFHNENSMLSVFVSQYHSIPNGQFAVAPEQVLPDPDLPGSRSQHDPSPESLGVNMRDTEQQATISGQHEEIGSSVLTPEDSGLIGTRDRRSVQLQIPVYQPVAEETCLQWINIQYPEPTHTSGEENLQRPLITDIALNEEQTERKVRQQRVLNLNAHDLTLLSPDGNPTTCDNRSTMVEQRPDANSVLEIACQLSTSVTEQEMFPASPPAPAAECPYTYPGSMGDVQARADTFEQRWPHPHLSPRRMAEAGFFYTGEGDTARCFSCRKTLIKWEKEDDPFVEHSKHSPNCKYLQNVRKRLPQNFGACCGFREAQLDEVLETEDLPYESEETTEEQLGSYRYALREGDNGQQRLEMVPSNSDNEQVQGLGRPNPHAEQDQDTLERHHSEALAGTEYNQHAESSGIQESRYQSSSTDLSARLLEHTYQSAEVHNGGDQIGMEAIDEDLFNYYLGTEEVGIVFSEGYSLEDISQVVATILRAGRPVTMDLLRQELHNIGARRQI